MFCLPKTAWPPTLIVHVVAPKAEAEPVAAEAEAAAAPAEPEVIKKGKAEKEEEGGDGS